MVVSGWLYYVMQFVLLGDWLAVCGGKGHETCLFFRGKERGGGGGGGDREGKRRVRTHRSHLQSVGQHLPCQLTK